MTPSLPIVLAQEVTRTMFEWGRVQSNADWIAPIAVGVAWMLYARWMARRDTRELGPAMGWLLTALRSLVVLLLLILYLQPQWRAEQERQVSSRAVVLVDTSLSMGLTDEESGSESRSQQVAAALTKSRLIEQLRQRHDVVLLRFGDALERVASWPKFAPSEPALENSPASSAPAGGSPEPDLAVALAPVAPRTRLGEAIREAIEQERGATVAGLVLLGDGQHNAGVSPEAAAGDAREAKIPLFPVGVGSDRPRANVRVSDFVAPARAYPGDEYTATGYVQAEGLGGAVVSVALLWRDADAPDTAGGTLVERRQITLGADGEVLPVAFTLKPDATGRRTLVFQVEAPPTDHDRRDNRRETDVEVVDRKNRVLLFAGGPTREYRFLRNMLHRDASTTVDVLLQSGKAGISQDAAAVLDDFPATREAMYTYDCVVAFDPDWQALGAAQLDLLESWVAEQGGGLVLVAGPVHMGNPIRGWIQDEQMAKLRDLSPVTFHRRFAMETASYASKDPWPLEFTREGREAPFLWLGDDATGSERDWSEFPGVYGFYPVRGPKPGATVYARFSDPRAAEGGAGPVYMAGQFYGGGRVFYLGSGEMWRLRAVEEAWFDTFYTKLIRHVSEGRLLRGSPRGALLVGQDRYVLGSAVEVRAQLTNARLEPLAAPSVTLQVIQPDGSTQRVTLRAEGTRPGTFAGHFTALREGACRLEIPLPESADQRLTRRIQVTMPDVEREHPQRNDALLSKLAAATGGRYYVGLTAALGTGGPAPILDPLPDRAKTIITPVAPDRRWQERWLLGVMLAVCGLLCAEWLLRRLMRLA